MASFWLRFLLSATTRNYKEEVFFLYDTTDAAAQVANQVRRLSGQVFFFYYYFSFPPCVRVCFALCCSDQPGRSLFFLHFQVQT